MKLLALILLFAATAHARTWQINLIQSHGPREVSRQDAIGMLTIARAKFSAIGVKTRIGRVSYSKLLNPAYHLADYWRGVYYWQKRLPPRTNIIRHVLTPPFYENGSWYIAGASPGICLLRWKYIVSTSNAQLKNQNGADRFYHSAIAMTHELGHVFGAKHTKSHSIMNLAALAFNDVAAITFAPESVTQIYSCIN